MTAIEEQRPLRVRSGPFAWVEPHASFTPDQQTFATTIKSSHPANDGASYDVPNFPVLELARWLAARSKGAYFNLNDPGKY